MLDKRSCRLIASCKECGGNNLPTGRIELGRAPTPLLGNHAWYLVQFVEYKCEACDFEEWCEEDVEVSPQ